MITLTTPVQINTVLGGNVPVAYNKLVISPFTFNPVTRQVTGMLRLTSTTNPSNPPINGTLNIGLNTNELTLEIDRLDFTRQVTLTTAQVNSVQTIINNAQNALESGLVSLGVIAGTQAAGA